MFPVPVQVLVPVMAAVAPVMLAVMLIEPVDFGSSTMLEPEPPVMTPAPIEVIVVWAPPDVCTVPFPAVEEFDRLRVSPLESVKVTLVTALPVWELPFTVMAKVPL